MSKPRILFILHLPPPVHGAAVMGDLLRGSWELAEAFDCQFLNLSSSRSLEEIGKGRFRKLLFILDLLRRERNLLREWKPDLVYVTPTSTLPALWKDIAVVRRARRNGVRTVLHFHNKGVSARSARWLDDRVYRYLFDGVDVILISDLLRSDVERYVKPERISICPNGLDFLACQPTDQGEVPQLLFLSNLLPDKGLSDLLDACVLLRDRGVPFGCRIVGSPTPQLSADGLRLMLEDRKLVGTVVYDGPKYGADKQATFAGADIFVHPTREDCFPLVVLEAMAAGLPVVSTREGGIPDEVEDGKTGLLCPKGDPGSLADALEELLMDASLREQMGAAGRERYQEHFTSACFERRMLEILKSYV